jgi:hypothetical protein
MDEIGYGKNYRQQDKKGFHHHDTIGLDRNSIRDIALGNDVLPKYYIEIV